MWGCVHRQKVAEWRGEVIGPTETESTEYTKKKKREVDNVHIKRTTRVASISHVQSDTYVREGVFHHLLSRAIGNGISDDDD